MTHAISPSSSRALDRKSTRLNSSPLFRSHYLLAQHLHVTRQHDQVDLRVAQDLQEPLLLLRLRLRCDGQRVISQSVRRDGRRALFVIADDARDLAVELAGA